MGYATIVKMRERTFTKTPPEEILSAFFGSGPTATVLEDGFWCYEIADGTGVSLRLSFNIHEMSVQTVILLGDREIETVIQEGADELRIEGDSLIGTFSLTTTTRLEVSLRPQIVVRWYTLRNA